MTGSAGEETAEQPRQATESHRGGAEAETLHAYCVQSLSFRRSGW